MKFISNNLRRLFFAFFMVLGLTQDLYASQGVAVDLTYTCVDPAIGRYRFRLVYYRDCSGITPGGGSLAITLNGGSCMSGTTIPLTQVSVTNVSQLCPGVTSTCNGGTNPGVQEYVYEGTVTIGTGCSNLQISFSECCRTNAITNLVNPGSSTYVETVINTNHPNWTNPCNSSPQFNNTPILYTCSGQPTYYNHGASDPDGDSLVFSVSNPLQAAPPGGNLAYSGAFTTTQPLCTNNTFALDPTNGQIQFTPCAGQPQYAVIGFIIQEYRNGILIGTTRREVTVIVLNNCTNQSTQLDSFQVNQGVIDTSGIVTSINVCGGNVLDLCINISDPNSTDSLRISSDIASVIPGASYTVTYIAPGFNRARICFNVPTNNIATGSYNFLIFISDGACPIPAQQVISYRLDLENLQLSTNKQFVCPNRLDTIQLDASGFGGAAALGTYSWSPAGLFNNPNIFNPLAFVVGEVDLICTYTEGACVQRDTVQVTAPFPAIINPIPDVTVCNGQGALVIPSIVPGPGPANYTFSGPRTIFPDTIMDFPLNISNVVPEQILLTSINRICLNINQQLISDLNIFLISPTGCILPLMSGNGGIVTNSISNVCFTPSALINLPTAPFAAVTSNTTYIPVGGAASWNNLLGCDANGQWILRIQHSKAVSLGGVAGTLSSFTVSFNDQSDPTFNWSPNFNISCTVCDSAIVSPPVDTSYRVIVRNVFGCSDTTSFNVNVDTSYPAPIIVCDSITPTSVQFVWQPIFGSGGYRVAVNGGAPFNLPVTQTRFTVTGLNPGQCANIEIFALTGGSCANGPSSIQSCCALGCLGATVTTTQTSCNGGFDGTATAVLNGGTAPFTFLWSSGGQTDQTAVGLSAGTYTVTVTESTGCSITATATLTQPSVLSLSAASVPASCFGSSTGSASSNASGANGNYTFVWSNGQNTQNISGLAAGQYCVTATDLLGCTATTCTTITEPSAVTATANNTNVSCFGGTNGTASASGSGGTGSYTFLWPSNATTASVSGLSAGTYTVTVSDANNCSATATVTVTQPSQTVSTTANITSNFSGNSVSCFGSCNGSAEAVPSGGTAPYSFLWSNGQTTINASALCAGQATVTVTDFAGCSSQASVTLTQPTSVTASIASQTNISCAGGSNGTATATATGGSAPYGFIWSVSSQTTSIATGLSAGIHRVTVSDANACTATASVTVSQPSAVSVTSSVISNYNSAQISCNGLSNGITISQWFLVEP